MMSQKSLHTLKIYFQLLEVFAVREIKSRYRGSLLGPVWVLLFPLLTAFALNIIFGIFVKIQSGSVPYFLFLFIGLLIWNFFQESLALARDSLIWGRNLITKSSFSKDTLPLSYVLSKIPDFFVNISIFLLFYFWFGYRVSASLFLILIVMIPLVLFTMGIALIVALFNAIFRDFGKIFDLILMLLFYATPVIYPESLIPKSFKIFIYLNPLSLFILFMRSLFFKTSLPIGQFLIASVLSIFIFIIGMLVFKKFEKRIVDLI